MAWVVGGRVLSVWVCRSRCVEGIGHGDGCRRLVGVCAFGEIVRSSGLKTGRWLKGMCVVCMCKGGLGVRVVCLGGGCMELYLCVCSVSWS